MTTTTYLLREIPSDDHDPATLRAAREGRSLRWVLLAALRDYASGVWNGGGSVSRKKSQTTHSRR